MALMQQTFQDKVEAIREARDLRKTELARRMGEQPQYLTRYLSGERSPGLDVIEKVATALGGAPWLLLDDTPIEKILRASA